MKTSLWIVIIVVAGAVGFLSGYSVPSFLHAGAAVSEGVKSAPAPAMDKAASDYYKHLLEE